MTYSLNWSFTVSYTVSYTVTIVAPNDKFKHVELFSFWTRECTNDLQVFKMIWSTSGSCYGGLSRVAMFTRALQTISHVTFTCLLPSPFIFPCKILKNEFSVLFLFWCRILKKEFIVLFWILVRLRLQGIQKRIFSPHADANYWKIIRLAYLTLLFSLVFYCRTCGTSKRQLCCCLQLLTSVSLRLSRLVDGKETSRIQRQASAADLFTVPVSAVQLLMFCPTNPRQASWECSRILRHLRRILCVSLISVP